MNNTNDLQQRIDECLEGKKIITWCGTLLIMEEGRKLKESTGLRAFLDLYNRENPQKAVSYQEIVNNSKAVEDHFVPLRDEGKYI